MKNEEFIIVNNDIFNLFKSMDIGIIFFDKGFKIWCFIFVVWWQFNFIDFDVGCLIINFVIIFKGLDIEEVCQEVFRIFFFFEKEIVDKEGDYYLLWVFFYCIEEDYIDGLVLIFVNINEFVILCN